MEVSNIPAAGSHICQKIGRRCLPCAEHDRRPDMIPIRERQNVDPANSLDQDKNVRHDLDQIIDSTTAPSSCVRNESTKINITVASATGSAIRSSPETYLSHITSVRLPGCDRRIEIKERLSPNIISHYRTDTKRQIKPMPLRLQPRSASKRDRSDRRPHCRRYKTSHNKQTRQQRQIWSGSVPA